MDAAAIQAEKDALNANIEALATNKAEFAALSMAVDVGWRVYAGVLVFMMHAGFALLEAGWCRQKNYFAILFKAMITIAVAALSWEAMGYGFAFGEDNSDAVEGGGFVGTDMFTPQDEQLAADGTGDAYSFYFFQWTFCATTATIVSGAVAERVNLIGYTCVALWMTLVVYPIVVHWCWGGGWLYNWDSEDETTPGYLDFAGSGVVHMVGGFAALTGAKIIGPRTGRFDGGNTRLGKPTNCLNIALGTFLLWFGWYGFNAGSTVALSGGASMTSARCCATTMMAASCGGIAFVIFNAAHERQLTVAGFANGVLGGLVGITAGCSNVDLDAACLIGTVGGIVVDLATIVEQKVLKIDDVVGAWPVHGAAGMWGVFSAALFDRSYGATAGSESEHALGVNCVGILAIIGWTIGTTAPVYMGLNAAGIWRVDLETEMTGLDEEFEKANYPVYDSNKGITSLSSIQGAQK